MGTPNIPNPNEVPNYTPPPGYPGQTPPYYAPPPGYSGQGTPNFTPPPNQPYLQPGMPGPLFLRSQQSSLAIVSMIAGIVGLTFIPLIGSIVAVITGHMAKNEINRSNGAFTGDGFAIAGLILGYIGIGFFVIGLLFVIAIVGIGFTQLH